MDAALHAIDLHVLVLLFGVLLIAAYLTEAQFFRLAAYLVLTRAKSARSLLFGLMFVAGALSAFLVNDTVCVVLTPLVVAVVVEARLPALPYLLALASAANVGGVVSFAGNPQNMIVGAAAHGTLGVRARTSLLTLPVGVVCLAANAALLVLAVPLRSAGGALAERSPPRAGGRQAAHDQGPRRARAVRGARARRRVARRRGDVRRGGADASARVARAARGVRARRLAAARVLRAGCSSSSRASRTRA